MPLKTVRQLKNAIGKILKNTPDNILRVTELRQYLLKRGMPENINIFEQTIDQMCAEKIIEYRQQNSIVTLKNE